MSPKLIDKTLAKRSYMPGPGAYTSSNFHLRTAPAFGLGSEIRNSLKKENAKQYVPDGGAYNPKSNFTKSSASAWGFGTEKRKAEHEKLTTKVPGPG